MKNKLSRTEAKERIEEFFEKNDFKPEEVKKIKRFAMRYNIKLGEYRKKFCKKCYANLRDGKIRIKDKTKEVECRKCGYLNRWKIKSH